MLLRKSKQRHRRRRLVVLVVVLVLVLVPIKPPSKKRKLKKLLADDKEFVAQDAASWDAAFSILNLEAWDLCAAPKKKACDGAGSAGTGARPCTNKTSKKQKLKKLLANDGEFTFKRVISQTKEPISCQGDKCSKQAISSWESNLNPEDNWDLCERCQVDFIGGSTKKR